MNILLTNDDGFEAPGILAAYQALAGIGSVHVVAPKTERSACSHQITLRRPIVVESLEHPEFGKMYAVQGTPADCVRLATAELLTETPDLLVSGINRGANAGVDVFYSGTVAAAREGALLGIKSIAVSQAVREHVETDWTVSSKTTAFIVEQLRNETLPGPGFWSVNLPAPIPNDPRDHIRRVAPALQPTPMKFSRRMQDRNDSNVIEFEYDAPYWDRKVESPTDYSALCDGYITISAIPLAGKF